jgi:hypothetical protein
MPNDRLRARPAKEAMMPIMALPGAHLFERRAHEQ